MGVQEDKKSLNRRKYMISDAEKERFCLYFVCAFLAAYCNLCLNATTNPPNYVSGLRSQVIEGKRNEHSHPAATILDYGYSHGP